VFDACAFQPATWEKIEVALAEAIWSSTGGEMTRNAEVFLAGVCAKRLADKLALAGFRVHAAPPGVTDGSRHASARGQRVAILAAFFTS
jgi:hypothetical protein